MNANVAKTASLACWKIAARAGKTDFHRERARSRRSLLQVVSTTLKESRCYVVHWLLEGVMTINRTLKSRWGLAILQLALLCLALVVLFAVVYWGIDALNWGTLQNRSGERVVGFPSFLFFSVETFFRIGYGSQIPVGTTWLVVTLEALSHLIVEVVFIAHLAILGLNKIVMLSDRTRLENSLNRF